MRANLLHPKKSFRKKMPKRKTYGGKNLVTKGKAKKAKKTLTATYTRRLPWAPQMCPPSIMVRLNYATSYKPASILFDKVFGGNALYDPDISGTGHQVMGFDEWMSIYSAYRVYGSTIKVTTINKSTTVGALAHTVVLADNEGTGATSDEQMEENANAIDADAGVATGPSEDTITMTMTTSQIRGVPDIRYSSEFAGDDAFNPSTLWFWRVVHANSDGSSLNCDVNVNLTYTVELFRPKLMQQS